MQTQIDNLVALNNMSEILVPALVFAAKAQAEQWAGKHEVADQTISGRRHFVSATKGECPSGQRLINPGSSLGYKLYQKARFPVIAKRDKSGGKTLALLVNGPRQFVRNHLDGIAGRFPFGDTQVPYFMHWVRYDGKPRTKRLGTSGQNIVFAARSGQAIAYSEELWDANPNKGKSGAMEITAAHYKFRILDQGDENTPDVIEIWCAVYSRSALMDGVMRPHLERFPRYHLNIPTARASLIKMAEENGVGKMVRAAQQGYLDMLE